VKPSLMYFYVAGVTAAYSSLALAQPPVNPGPPCSPLPECLDVGPFASIPEPQTLMLFAAGAVAIVLTKWWRGKK
jgi:hypothetical protein